MAEDTQVGWASGPSGVLEPLHRTTGSTTPVRLVDRLTSEVERLRVLVQALEEECAAREIDARRLASNLRTYRQCWLNDHPTGRTDAADLALANHVALTARYAPGAPDPLPDPVEGDTEALSGQSDVSEAVAAIEAILERNARLERDLHIARGVLTIHRDD